MIFSRKYDTVELARMKYVVTMKIFIVQMHEMWRNHKICNCNFFLPTWKFEFCRSWGIIHGIHVPVKRYAFHMKMLKHLHSWPWHWNNLYKTINHKVCQKCENLSMAFTCRTFWPYSLFFGFFTAWLHIPLQNGITLKQMIVSASK